MRQLSAFGNATSHGRALLRQPFDLLDCSKKRENIGSLREPSGNPKERSLPANCI